MQQNKTKEQSKGQKGMSRHLLESAFLMGGLTMVSRVLGMVRDIVCARSYGTSWQWDGFIYAFMIPNFFRRLVAEGAVSSAFIPVYSQVLTQKGKDNAMAFANTALTLCGAGFIFVLLVLEIGLSYLMNVGALSETLKLTVDLLRFFFPYLCLMSVIAIGMGILNSHNHFLTPSLGPIFLNVFWIVGVLWVAPRLSKGETIVELRWVAGAILLSAFAQLFIQLPPLYRAGFRIRLVWDFFSDEIKTSFKLFLPAIVGFAIVPLNVLVDMTLGLLIGEGANSSLWYGNRLMQLPLGVFAISMGTALLPNLSGQFAGGKIKEAERAFRFALKSVLFIIVPCTVGLIVLRTPIIELLFQRGEFDATSTQRTANVLFCYSIGLFAYSGQKILTSGFYAVQNTRIPVRIAAFSFLLNIVMNLILMGPLKEAGLALATSLSAIVQFFLLFYFCQKKVVALDMNDILPVTSKMIFSSLLMGILCFVAFRMIPSVFPESATLSLAAKVFGAIVCSMASYPLLCALFGIREASSAVKWLFRKKPILEQDS